MPEWPSSPTLTDLERLERRLAAFLECRFVLQLAEHLRVLEELERTGAAVTAMRPWYVEFFAHREEALRLLVAGVPGVPIPHGGHPDSVREARENAGEIACVARAYDAWRHVIVEILDAPPLLDCWRGVCEAMATSAWLEPPARPRHARRPSVADPAGVARPRVESAG